MPDAVLSVLLVEMDDGLGVAVRGESVPPRLELVAELAVVVDLPVENDDHRAVLVGDRLIARLEVDHAQALNAERHAVGDELPARVRPSVLDRSAHALQELRRDPAAVDPYLSRDPTHQVVVELSGDTDSGARWRLWKRGGTRFVARRTRSDQAAAKRARTRAR